MHVQLTKAKVHTVIVKPLRQGFCLRTDKRIPHKELAKANIGLLSANVAKNQFD